MAPTVNSVSGGEIELVHGSTHEFVDADHPGCDICGQLRDAGQRVLKEGSTEAMEEFRRVQLAGLTDLKEKFRRARKSDEWTLDNYSVSVWAAEEGHIVIELFLRGVNPKPDGEAKGDARRLAEGEGHSEVVQALRVVPDVAPEVGIDAIIGVQSNALCDAARDGHVGGVEDVPKHPKVNVEGLARVEDRSPLHEAAELKQPDRDTTSNEMASSSVNSVSGGEIQRVHGSTHDFIGADHAGCGICEKLRDDGKRVLLEVSTEAMENFRRVSVAGFTEAKDDFLRARKAGKWAPDNYSAFHWGGEEGHIVIVQFLLGVDPKPDGEAKGDALILAAREGHSQFVQALLDFLDVDPKVDVDVITKVQSFALYMAAGIGHVGVVEAVLKHPKVSVKALARDEDCFPLHEAARMGHTGVVEVLLKHPEFDVNFSRWSPRVCRWTPLHWAVARGHNRVVEILLTHPSVDVNATDREGFTPLHWAVCVVGIIYDDVHWRIRKEAKDLYLMYEFMNYCVKETESRNPEQEERTERDKWKTVRVFAKHIDGHNFDQENDFSKTALEYAYVAIDVTIWQILSQAEPVKIYIEGLYKDRQVYVDAANAILVGAALIASVTFGSWLEPPLSYTIGGDGYSSQSFQGTPASSSMPKYVDVKHNMALRVFWVFNCFSFYFAMATVVAGACSVLPRRKLFIKRIVQKLRQYLIATSLLLGCSVLCVIIAFGIAGSIVLAPMFKFQWVMIVPTAIGGLICLIRLGILLKNIVEDWDLKDIQICLPRCFTKHKRDE